MRFINPVIILTAILSFSAFGVFAQETEETVVDEVIAQVNEDVITLSQINRELEFTTKSLIAEGKTEAEAKAFVEKQKGQLIANIINEALLVQKGKELGLDREVEVEINKRLTEQMTKNNLKSLDELYVAMRQSGVEPNDLRKVWSSQIMRELVMGEAVSRPLYFQISDKEIKEYYAKNKDKFKKEATITISEIFLSFAGKDEAAVREKAKQIVARAKKGEDFAKLAVENSDRPNVGQTKGKAGTFNISQLDKVFAGPLKDLKQGEVTDPITIDIGMEILRVDERTAASNESSFNEDSVRQALWKIKLPEAQNKFMKDLKEDSYIKIRETYRPMVNPFLNADPNPVETTASK